MKRLFVLFIFFLMIPLVAALPGDMNSDNIVDVFDLIIVGSHFGLTSTDPGWDPRADSNENGVIDVMDLADVSTNIGNKYNGSLTICDENTPCNETITENNVTKWCRNINDNGYEWHVQQGCMGSCGSIPDCEENPEGTNVSCAERDIVCEDGSWVDRVPTPHTIGVRIVDNNAEFYNRNTGETFVLRGNSFVRIGEQLSIDGQKTVIWHSLFNRGEYNPTEVRNILSQMKANEYNSVRVWINGIRAANPSGEGLDPVYMANVADFLNKAKKQNLFVRVQLAGIIPPTYLNYPWTSYPMIRGHNILYLTKEGIDAHKAYAIDFIKDLKSQGAPIEQILAYEIRGEPHFLEDLLPLSLTSGIVTTVTGNYDMSSLTQRNQMMEDGIIFFIDEVRAVIREHDPTALVSVCAYPPSAVANDNRIVPPMGKVVHESSADYLDLHFYLFRGQSIAQQAADAQIPSQLSKPLIMGEFGQKITKERDVTKAAVSLRDWQVESCNYGFGGWSLFTWDPWEQPKIDFGQQSERIWWSAVDNNGVINAALAPIVRKNPCVAAATPDDHDPRGWLGAITCDNIFGWAVDMDTPSDSIKVHIYKDGPAGTGTFVTGAKANIYRAGVNDYLNITGNHGFSLPTPASLKDGKQHSIYVHGIDISGKGVNKLLNGVPKTIMCS